MFIVGVCMFACIQGYWNGPMGLMHGGAGMLAVAVASVSLSLLATLHCQPKQTIC
jgi:purine-cytosine permease-like protein